MKARLGITFLFFCTMATLQAQIHYQMATEALRDFTISNYMRYEELPVTWNMEGTIQADLNNGINYLLEDNPGLAENSFNLVLKRDSSIWQAYYFRAAAKKKLEMYYDAESDLERAIDLHKDFYEAYVELAKVYYLRREIDKSDRAAKKAIQLDAKRGVAYFLRGDVNLIKNQIKAAVGNYNECLAADKNFHDARLRLCMIELVENKNEKAAITQLDKTLAIDSLEPHALLLRSILHFENNRQQALRDLNNLITIRPDHLMAYYLRGMEYTNLENYERGFSDFQKVIKATSTSDNNFAGQQTWVDKKINIQNVGAYTLSRMYGLPDDDIKRVQQAYCYIVINENDKALNLLIEISDPSEPLAAYLKAVANEHVGNHPTAYKFYDLAINLDNSIADAYKKRAIYKQELKQWASSAQDFTKVLQLMPESFVIYRIRGVSYYYDGQLEKAIADYTMYLKYDSMNQEVLGYRGVAYRDNKQPLQAYEDFARSNNFSNLDYFDIIKQLDKEVAKGDTARALGAMDIFIKASPNCTPCFVRKFKLNIAQKNWKEVEGGINHAIAEMPEEANPKDRSYLLTIKAMNLARHGSEKEALQKFAEAIVADSYNDMAYLERGKLYLTMKQEAKANADFKKASTLGSKEAEKLLKE